MKNKKNISLNLLTFIKTVLDTVTDSPTMKIYHSVGFHYIKKIITLDHVTYFTHF